jgi:hypothetical protein
MSLPYNLNPQNLFLLKRFVQMGTADAFLTESALSQRLYILYRELVINSLPEQAFGPVGPQGSMASSRNHLVPLQNKISYRHHMLT